MIGASLIFSFTPEEKKVAGLKEKGVGTPGTGWNRVGTPRCFGSPAPRNPEFPEIEGGWTPANPGYTPTFNVSKPGYPTPLSGCNHACFYIVVGLSVLPASDTHLLGGYMVKWSSVSMFGGCVWHGPLEEERAEV
jgi:hypothetical protein